MIIPTQKCTKGGSFIISQDTRLFLHRIASLYAVYGVSLICVALLFDMLLVLAKATQKTIKFTAGMSMCDARGLKPSKSLDISPLFPLVARVPCSERIRMA